MAKEGDGGIFSQPTAGNKMQYWSHLVSFTVTELQKDPSIIVSNSHIQFTQNCLQETTPLRNDFGFSFFQSQKPQNNYS